MEGEIDIRLVVTIAGMLVSVAGAAAVARQSIKQLTALIADIETRLRRLDSQQDRLTTEIKTLAQRLGILAQISSPASLERRHLELGGMLARLSRCEIDVAKQAALHNGVHPVTAVSKE